MNRRSIFAVVAAVVLLASAATSFAAGSSQSTFSITPPPIATPVFGTRETDIKVGAMYVGMKSTDTTVTDFKLSGYGLDMIGRSAFGSVVAMDYSVGVIYLSGDIKSALTGTSSTKSKISGASIPISFNLEVQPYKNDVFNFIIFAGPAFNISVMDMEITIPSFTGTGTTKDTITSTSFMYGPQGGVQTGFEIGDIHVDLFGMFVSQKGTQDTSSSLGGSTSTDIPSTTTTSYGADFMYVPWGLTLSSILQEAKSNDKNGFKTTVYQLSWSHKF
jgi:hypothetical protein